MFILGIAIITDARVKYCSSFTSYLIFWVTLALIIFYFFTFQLSLLAGISLDLYRIELCREQESFYGSQDITGAANCVISEEHLAPYSTDPSDPMSVYQQGPSTTPGQGSGTREALLGEGDPDAYNVSFMDKLKKNYKVHSSRIRDRIINTYGEDAQTAEDQEALRRIEEGSEGTTFTDNAV